MFNTNIPGVMGIYYFSFSERMMMNVDYLSSGSMKFQVTQVKTTEKLSLSAPNLKLNSDMAQQV